MSLLHIQLKNEMQPVKADPLFEAYLCLLWVSIAMLLSIWLPIFTLWTWYLQEVLLRITSPMLSHCRAKLVDSGLTLSSWVTCGLSCKILPSSNRQELTLRHRAAPHKKIPRVLLKILQTPHLSNVCLKKLGNWCLEVMVFSILLTSTPMSYTVLPGSWNAFVVSIRIS